MANLTLCWPLQIVQYFSQVQYCSAFSHIAHTTGPRMGSIHSELYLSIATRGKEAVAHLHLFLTHKFNSEYGTSKRRLCTLSQFLTAIKLHASIVFLP